MRRIYFLAPNIKTTHAIVEELRNEGIEDRHIHILAKRDTPLLKICLRHLCYKKLILFRPWSGE